MRTLVKKVHQEVSKFCHMMAEKEHKGYAQAAWFEQNGLDQVENKLNCTRVSDWIQKAITLGYSIEEVEVKPYISTHSVWYAWTSLELSIPIYGKYSYTFDKFEFPSNSQLPKAFILPYLEREVKEAEEEAERKAAEEAAREAAKAAREKEKAEWIRQYGSEYLKDCLNLGLKANREYVIERAALEFPDFTVDYTGNADWQEKLSPSIEAVAELKELRNAGANADIVWLIKPAIVKKDEEYYEYNDEFQPCEAIIVRDFLGKYDLVKII